MATATTTASLNVTGLDHLTTMALENVSDLVNLSKANMTDHNKLTAGELRDFYIGLGLAISSSLFIGSSFILKKKGLLKLAHRAGDGGYGYLKEWMWWAGLLLMAVGELCNFTAYAFAPATVVTPLGALSVLVSAMLASKMLKERLNLLGKLGCLICILGSTVVVLHAPKEQELQTMDELQTRLGQPAFIVYTVFIVVASLVLIFYFSPRYGTKNPMIYVTITGTIGSLSVMGCKGLGVALKQTFSGDNQFTNWLTYFVIFSIAVCITTQLNYMNKALDVFNTSVVTPMLYVVFTAFVILASAILFEEWYTLNAVDMVGILCGFFTIVSGIFLLNAFKEQKITLSSVKIHRTDSVVSNGQVQHDVSRKSSTNELLSHNGNHGGNNNHRYMLLEEQEVP